MKIEFYNKIKDKLSNKTPLKVYAANLETKDGKRWLHIAGGYRLEDFIKSFKESHNEGSPQIKSYVSIEVDRVLKENVEEYKNLEKLRE